MYGTLCTDTFNLQTQRQFLMLNATVLPFELTTRYAKNEDSIRIVNLPKISMHMRRSYILVVFVLLQATDM